MKAKNVIRLKNFEGYEFHCNRCGREIKNVYFIQGADGFYGKECVAKLAGKGYVEKEFNRRGNSKESFQCMLQNNGMIDKWQDAMRFYGSNDKYEIYDNLGIKRPQKANDHGALSDKPRKSFFSFLKNDPLVKFFRK